MSIVSMERAYDFMRDKHDYGNIAEKSRVGRQAIKDVLLQLDQFGAYVEHIYKDVRPIVAGEVGEDYEYDLFEADLEHVLAELQE